MLKTFRWIFVVAVLVAWWPIPMAATQSGTEAVHRTRVFNSPVAIVDVNGLRRPPLVAPLAAIPAIIALRLL